MNQRPNKKSEARTGGEIKKTEIKKSQSSASTSSKIAKVLAESQSKNAQEKK